MKPDGIFLSNGPGDPAATGEYAVPVIQDLLKTDIPVFGICLGHQMLALALGGKTEKMHQGHHGANHPVKDHTTGKVEIVSMNHGFAVDAEVAAGRRRGNPRLAVRRLELRHALTGKPGLLGAASPGSLARPAGFALPLPPLRQPHPRAARRTGAGRALSKPIACCKSAQHATRNDCRFDPTNATITRQNNWVELGGCVES